MAPVPPAESILVLCVDDDRALVDLTATYLEREDDRVETITATDGQTGLSLLREHPVDCVVSDYQMPEMDGLSFLAAVRETCSELPFVLFTGKGSEEIASEAISAGVDDYLQKEGTDQYQVLAGRVANLVDQRRAETSYREVFQKTDVGMTVRDPTTGRFVDVNERYCDLMGYSREELLNLTQADITDGESPYTSEEGLELLRTAVEEGTQSIQSKNRTSDGTPVWVDVTLTPATISGSERVLVTVQDVTERRRHLSELEETNTVLTTLLENLPVGVLVEDADREIRTVNAELPALLGVDADPEDLVGRDCAEAASGLASQFADPDAFVEGIETVLDRRDPVHREYLDLADGRTLARSYVPYSLPDGPANLWLYRDVTEERATVRKLRTLHTRMEDLLRTSTRAETATVCVETVRSILDVDMVGLHLRDASGDALEPVATTDAVGEQLGEPPTYRRPDGPDPDPVSAVVWEVFETGDSLFLEDVDDHDRLSGETTAESGIVQPIDDHGVLIVSARERGEFGETESALLEIFSTAVTAALDRAGQEELLRDRAEALEGENERLQQFASTVSHDLQNPLAIASGFLDLARKKYGDDDYFAEIANAHTRMERLVEELLQVARRDDDPVREPVSLATLAREHWRTVPTEDLTLDVADEAVVEADPTRLGQLFENLFRNAAEHATGPGAGEDDDPDASVTVTVGTLADPDGFYVADDGPGIPEDEVEAVFEPGRSTADEGTGFGLTIVRTVAAAHGWSVDVTTSADGGARFEVTGVDVVDGEDD